MWILGENCHFSFQPKHSQGERLNHPIFHPYNPFVGTFPLPASTQKTLQQTGSFSFLSTQRDLAVVSENKDHAVDGAEILKSCVQRKPWTKWKSIDVNCLAGILP